jgi:hypothetical protein
MIKITYKTFIEGMPKPEFTTISIFDGRWFIRYDIVGKAESTYKKMKEDGRKVYFRSGVLIQEFKGKSKEELLELALADIENGRVVAEKQSGKKVEIKHLKIEK